MAKKRAEEREVTEHEAGEAKVYELGFHLDPELPVEDIKTAYQELRALIEGKGKLAGEGEPAKVALAYTISRQEVSGRRDFNSAYFAWIAYEAPAEAHEEVAAAAAADKRIIRFIDLVTDKETVRNAMERQELAAKTPERDSEMESESESTGADAALDAALENATI